LAEQIGSRHQMQNRMRRALIYPLLVLLVLLGLVTFLVSVVIPSLAEFMLELDQSLPWHTRWLVGWCSWMRHYAPWLLLATAGLLSLLVLLRNRSGSFRLHTDRYLVTSRFPGCLIRDWFAAGFTHDLAALHGAGVALLPALNSTESLSRNRYIVLNLRLIMRQVNDGIGLAGAMRSTGLFNADCLHLILLAEKSGDYAKGLVQAEQLSGFSGLLFLWLARCIRAQSQPGESCEFSCPVSGVPLQWMALRGSNVAFALSKNRSDLPWLQARLPETMPTVRSPGMVRVVYWQALRAARR